MDYMAINNKRPASLVWRGDMDTIREYRVHNKIKRKCTSTSIYGSFRHKYTHIYMYMHKERQSSRNDRYADDNIIEIKFCLQFTFPL